MPATDCAESRYMGYALGNSDMIFPIGRDLFETAPIPTLQKVVSP
jgi:hypothetical protein